MSDVMFCYVQHQDGRPVSINVDKINDEDLKIPAGLALKFFEATETLDDWLVLDNVFCKNDMGLKNTGRGLLILEVIKEIPNKPSFIISVDYSTQTLDMYFDPIYEPDIRGTSFDFWIDQKIRSVKINDFENGHLRLHVKISPDSQFAIQEVFRHIYLTTGYEGVRYRSHSDRVVYVKLREDGMMRLPQTLYHNTVYYVDEKDHNRIIGKDFASTQVAYKPGTRIIVGAYEIRKH